MTPKDVAGSLWKKFEAYAKDHPHEKVDKYSIWADIWLAVGILKTLDDFDGMRIIGDSELKALVCDSYKHEEISAGRACELLGIDRGAFTEIYRAYIEERKHDLVM